MANKPTTAKEITSRGFHHVECDLCQRVTWHYYSGANNEIPHCTNHSDWKPGVRKPSVRDSTIIVGSLRNKPVHTAPSERELRIINRIDMKLWRTAEVRKSSVDIDDCEWAAGLFDGDDPQPKDPNKLYCTFCGTEVDHVHVTTEKKPKIRTVIETYKDGAGDIHVEEKVISQADTVYACPNCVLQVRKPIYVRRV